MAEPVPVVAVPIVPPPGGGGVPKKAEEGFFSSPLFQTLLRSAAIYVFITFITGANSPFKTKTPEVSFVAPTTNGETGGAGMESAQVVVAPVAVPAFSVVSLWPAGTLLVSNHSYISDPL